MPWIFPDHSQCVILSFVSVSPSSDSWDITYQEASQGIAFTIHFIHRSGKGHYFFFLSH